MTFAQILLAPIAALMVVDIMTTLKGLSRAELRETNALALRVISWFGVLPGVLVFEAAVFTVVSAVVVLFPSQWAMPLVFVVELALTVLSNLCWLKAQQKPRQAEA